jgi:uncharacterized protein
MLVAGNRAKVVMTQKYMTDAEMPPKLYKALNSSPLRGACVFDIVIGRDQPDLKKFGTDGTILLGRHYVKMGRTTSLSNRVLLDMIRSHVVFVCGKRGGGKCVSGETHITLANGERVQIKELQTRRDHLLSLDNNFKINGRPNEAFYSRPVQTLLKLRLRTGKEISLTPEHPLLTVSGWVDARQLTIGSRIATPRCEPAFGDKALPEHEVKLLAYLIAEGHLGNNQVLFSNMDERIVADYQAAVAAFDSRLQLVEHSKKGCYRIVGRQPAHQLVAAARNPDGRFTKLTRIDNRSEIRIWLEAQGLYGKRSRVKFCPSAIFTLPRHLLALFLNRLFSCDGSIYCEDEHFWKLSYASSSRELIDAVQHLLLRFGIVSSVRPKRSKRYATESYELEIKGEFVHTYLQEIGFFGVKTIRAQRALTSCIRLTRNPNTDTIPKEIWDSFQPENWAALGREIGYAHPKALRESTHYSPSRQKLLQIATAAHDELLERFATSDIFWDEIVGVEQLEGQFTVYDLTVPETHNFIANDIIVHNSYTMGVIAEGLADLPESIRKNLSIILLDTMGIYWTMKYPNMKDKDLLEQWGMKPHPLDITIFTPQGYYNKFKDQGIPTDYSFSVRPGELQGTDWTTTFSIDPNDPVGVLIESVIHQLKERDPSAGYSLKDIIAAIEKDAESPRDAKNAAKNHFQAAMSWGIFSQEGTPLRKLAAPGQVTVLDLSCYATEENAWNIKSLVIGLVAQKLFNERMVARKDEEFKDVERQTSYFSEEQLESDFPMVWLVVDEAHEFLPKEGKTLATDPLIAILREGRQPGISLILASQQPGKIHTDVMTQSDTVIAHRITAKIDTDALGALMQSYMRSGLDAELDNLPRTTGAALILDDNNEKMYPIQIRPRFTWHGGEAPIALKTRKELFDF